MKPATVKTIFLRQDEYAIDWPGAHYDVEGAIQDYSQALRKMGEELGIRIIFEEPFYDADDVAKLAEAEKAQPSDGLLVIPLSQIRKGKPGFLSYDIVDIGRPTVIFTPYLWWGRIGDDLSRKPGVYFLSTLDFNTVRYGLKMIRAAQQLRETQIIIVKGDDPPQETTLPRLGTKVRTIPRNRFVNALSKTGISEAVVAIAESYTQQADKIVEPSEADILEAAKAYVVAKRLLEAEGGNALSLDCLGLLRTEKLATTPCIANSRLCDEGIPAACERDLDSLLTMLILHYLFDKPSFIGDPTVDTVRNTWINSHCTSPTKLDGINSAPAPFALRRYGHLDLGVSPQVIWREGQNVTLAKFQSPDELVVGSGKVVGNIDTPPSHICVTSVEVALDNLADARDVAGFVERLHILTMYENKVKELSAFCQLMGLTFTQICDEVPKRYEDPTLDKVKIYEMSA